jgi:hypothetical protein
MMSPLVILVFRSAQENRSSRASPQTKRGNAAMQHNRETPGSGGDTPGWSLNFRAESFKIYLISDPSLWYDDGVTSGLRQSRFVRV